MLRRILLASAGAMALAGVALAQESTTPAPILWYGPYIGLHAGYAWGPNFSKLIFPDTDLTVPYFNNSQGVIGGFHVGYNYQFNQIVAGLEGTVDGSSFGKTFLPFPDKENIIYSTHANVQGAIRGRLGYVCVSYPAFLFYATGGVAFFNVNDIFDSRDFNGLYFDVSKTRVGPIFGGGIEYALTPNWLAGVEYLRTDFHFADSSPETPVKAGHDLTQNSVQLRLTYKFDTPITLTVDTSRPTID